MILRILMTPVGALLFGAWFAREILRSSVTVLKDVITPGLGATPRVVRLQLGRASDTHVTLISVLITLTPGTLALGVHREADGGRTVLVHSMYHATTAEALADLQDMDDRMIRAVRSGGPA